MTLTSLITLNAALGAAVVVRLLHLLAHGIHSDPQCRAHLQELAALPGTRVRPARRLSTSRVVASNFGGL